MWCTIPNKPVTLIFTHDVNTLQHDITYSTFSNILYNAEPNNNSSIISSLSPIICSCVSLRHLVLDI